MECSTFGKREEKTNTKKKKKNQAVNYLRGGRSRSSLRKKSDMLISEAQEITNEKNNHEKSHLNITTNSLITNVLLPEESKY
jgi:hypothetical protein